VDSGAGIDKEDIRKMIAEAMSDFAASLRV